VDVWTDSGIDRCDISGVGCVEADEKDVRQYRENNKSETWIASSLSGMTNEFLVQEEVAVQEQAKKEGKSV
jgi:hypothetical protein